MKCSNVNCLNFDEHATKPCHDCQERERLTELPDVKEKGRRIKRIQEALKHRKAEDK